MSHGRERKFKVLILMGVFAYVTLLILRVLLKFLNQAAETAL